MYIKAKEEMKQEDDEEKSIAAKIVKEKPALIEEEYNLEEKKEEECDINNQGLDDFMFSIKQSAATKATNLKYDRYSTNILPLNLPGSQAKKTTEDEEIFGFAQGATTGLDELEQLFGESSKPTFIPQYKVPFESYNQFSSLYHAYGQLNLGQVVHSKAGGNNPFDTFESKYT